VQFLHKLSTACGGSPVIRPSGRRCVGSGRSVAVRSSPARHLLPGRLPRGRSVGAEEGRR